MAREERKVIIEVVTASSELREPAAMKRLLGCPAPFAGTTFCTVVLEPGCFRFFDETTTVFGFAEKVDVPGMAEVEAVVVVVVVAVVVVVVVVVLAVLAEAPWPWLSEFLSLAAAVPLLAAAAAALRVLMPGGLSLLEAGEAMRVLLAEEEVVWAAASLSFGLRPGVPLAVELEVAAEPAAPAPAAAEAETGGSGCSSSASSSVSSA